MARLMTVARYAALYLLCPTGFSPTIRPPTPATWEWARLGAGRA